MNDITMEKKTRNRDPKVYIVTMNGEEYLIRAKSAQTALKFAVAETVTVAQLGASDLSRVTTFISRGGEILDATSFK